MPGNQSTKQTSLRTVDRAKEFSHIIAILHKWGVHTLGDLAALPPDQLGARLGPVAVLLWEQATGRATRLLRLVRPTEIFAEEIEFDYEIETTEPLLFVLRRFLEQLTLRLGALYLVAQEMTLPAHFCRSVAATRIAFTSPTRPTPSRFCSACSRPISKRFGRNIRSWPFPWPPKPPGRRGNSFIFSRRPCATRTGCTKRSPGSRDC